MTSWRESTLGDVCELYQPKTISSADLVADGEYPVYGANGVIGRFDKFNHAEPQLLVTCRGATCGSVNISQPNSWINGNAMVVKPRDSSVELDYLKHLFRGGLDLSAVITGAAQPQITRQSLAPLKIRYPAPAEQRRIAAILDQADALRAKRREALAQLDGLTQSIFIEMFGDTTTNPRKLPKLPIASMTTVSTGSTPSRAGGDYYGGAIPWVKTTEVNGEHIWSTEEKLTGAGFKAIRGKLHPVDSIIVAMYGQGQTRGRSALLKIPASCNQACGVIYPSPSFLSAFMFYQIRFAYDELRALGRGGNQENLNLQLLGAFEVLLPSPEHQQTFATRILSIESLKAAHRTSLAELDSLFVALQHRAFRGEL